jgi:hypothetical protein
MVEMFVYLLALAYIITTFLPTSLHTFGQEQRSCRGIARQDGRILA